MVLADGRIAVPRIGEPSTHLIKPEPERFAGLAANEAFCLALARAVGLDAATGQIQRLHQEDIAQALGVPSNRKYACEGGPTFRDCFALVRQATTRQSREVLKLADAAIFNLIIGNAAAHAKNFSLLRREDGEVVLAPFYDLVATFIWPELSAGLAMRFGPAASLEEVDGDSQVGFAQDSGLTLPFLRRRAAALAGQVEAAIARGIEVPGLADRALTGELSQAIADRAGRLVLKARG